MSRTELGGCTSVWVPKVGRVPLLPTLIQFRPLLRLSSKLVEQGQLVSHGTAAEVERSENETARKLISEY
jgi:hypothetical protein